MSEHGWNVVITATCAAHAVSSHQPTAHHRGANKKNKKKKIYLRNRTEKKKKSERRRKIANSRKTLSAGKYIQILLANCRIISLLRFPSAHPGDRRKWHFRTVVLFLLLFCFLPFPFVICKENSSAKVNLVHMYRKKKDVEPTDIYRINRRKKNNSSISKDLTNLP